MKLLVLFSVAAAVLLQQPNGGNCVGISPLWSTMSKRAKSSELSKRVNNDDEFNTALELENSPEFKAFYATLQRAVNKGYFLMGYFQSPEWRAFTAKLNVDPKEKSKLQTFYQRVTLAYSGPYKGKFFDKPEWKAYKLAAMKPTFFLINDYSDVTRNMNVAAQKAEREDKNFRRILEEEIDKLRFPFVRQGLL